LPNLYGGSDYGWLRMMCAAAGGRCIARRTMIADALRGLLRLQAERRRWQDQRQQAEERYEIMQLYFHSHGLDAAMEAKDTRAANFFAASILF
jgi:hypothetical protein